MAERSVNVVNPKTGERGSVPESKLARARATGSRAMTEAEKALILEERARGADIGGSLAAEAVGQVRGAGEAVGVPTDPLALGVADLFGKRAETQKYLADLREQHPISTGLGEIRGQVGGMVGLGEAMGGSAAARAPTALGRIGVAVGRGAVRGGIENVVIGSTHDVNEASLGDPNVAGQKLYARMPKHFAVGAIAGGVLSGLGVGAGEALSPLMKSAPGALDRQASAAIGRELGESGEGAIRLGSHVRDLNAGAMPKDASVVADLFAREQAGFRSAAQAGRAAEVDALQRAQTTEAWHLSAKQEAGREVAARDAARISEEVKAGHEQARRTLAEEHAKATEAVAKLSEERVAHAQKLKSLASDLDRVKGAELPKADNILREATSRFSGEGPSLTPPSPNATRIFNEWADTFAKKYSEPGALKFTNLRDVISSLDTMETRQRVVSGWGNDPEVSKAFAALKQAANSEFDRASIATASSVSEASSLNAQRLRAMTPEIEASYRNAADHAETLERAARDFERNAAREALEADRLAGKGLKGFEKRSAAEMRDLTRRQAADVRAVPKVGKETPVDGLLSKARSSASRARSDGSVGFGGMGALLSLAHGNVAGAAMSAVGGFAAHTARAQGNFLAARALRALGEEIAAVDAAIARGAARALGRGTSSSVKAAARAMVDDKPKRAPTFEQVAKRVREAQANPLLIDQHVRVAVGQWAPNAPQVYASVHAAALRSQQFLASKLPQPQKDPHSLTPHLEDDDLSDTEKHEFMQYVDALSWEPGEAYERVLDGTLTEQHVEAIRTVSPPLYEQMRAEVERQVIMLQKPLEYERAIHLGTLLEKTTDEVLDPAFQRTAMAMYLERSQSEEVAKGSKPSAGSKASRSMMSTSQRAEEGE